MQMDHGSSSSVDTLPAPHSCCKIHIAWRIRELRDGSACILAYYCSMLRYRLEHQHSRCRARSFMLRPAVSLHVETCTSCSLEPTLSRNYISATRHGLALLILESFCRAGPKREPCVLRPTYPGAPCSWPGVVPVPDRFIDCSNESKFGSVMPWPLQGLQTFDLEHTITPPTLA
jgi:hypothetical protein